MKQLLFVLLLCSIGTVFAQDKTVKVAKEKELYAMLTTKIFNDLKRKEPKEIIPDWNALEKSFAKKYDKDMVSNAILGAKISFYQSRISQDWNNVANAWVEQTERFAEVEKITDHLIMAMGVNNPLYGTIFKNATDTGILLRAATIARKMVDNPDTYQKHSQHAKDNFKANEIDTYANLLYKAGKVDEAIEWESKAVDLATASKKEEVVNNLKLMKEGKKTWK